MNFLSFPFRRNEGKPGQLVDGDGGLVVSDVLQLPELAGVQVLVDLFRDLFADAVQLFRLETFLAKICKKNSWGKKFVS